MTMPNIPPALIRVAPRQELIAEPPPLPISAYEQPQPQIVVVHSPSPRREPRLKAGGWFARSFMSASGVMLAVCLFLFGIPLLLCGGVLLGNGCQMAREAQQRAFEQRRKAIDKPE